MLVPILVMVHPPIAVVARDLVLPQLPIDGNVTDVMLLVIAIVGTTIAPWQLFFQQSYVIDKRITPRFIRYERIDLWIGIVLVLIGAVAMMAFSAQAFAGKSDFGKFTDAAGVAVGLQAYAGRLPGVLFAIGLIDASLIGAAAVSLATAYALGDVFSVNHSLHRKVGEAKGFYAAYCGLILVAAAIVLTPGAPLGLLTNAVQTLAGVLLPSATVFLLLLCNDKAVLGPWVNGVRMNIFTGAVIWLLVMMSVVLTASVLFPEATTATVILEILVGGAGIGLVAAIAVVWANAKSDRSARASQGGSFEAVSGAHWRMPPLSTLKPATLSRASRLWMLVLRGYLIVAGGLVLARIVMLAVK